MTNIDQAAAAILEQVKINPNLNAAALQEDLERSDVQGWMRLPAVRKCNLSQWSAAMSQAIKAIAA